MMDAIRTVSLVKKYKDVTAVDGLDITVENGELFALLGVNGAGKTTTIKMISGLAAPTSGEIYIFGKKTSDDPVSQRGVIAVSPQESAIAPGLTVKENLELMCGAYGFTKEKSRKLISEHVERFGLGEVSKRKAGKLSGGWQRRLSIAMALISEPEILFLDEPTLGLDVIARSELWDLIRSLKGKITIILTTHYMEEAEALSDRVAIMRDGRLLICDTVAGIKSAADTDDFEQAFINIVKGDSK